MVVAAAGNVRHEQLVELPSRAFSQLPESSGLEGQAPTEPPHGSIRAHACSQVHVCMGVCSCSYADQRKFAVLVLDTILGAGMSSRLFQRLREEHGAAYTTYSFADFLSDRGLLGVCFAMEPRRLEFCMDLVLSEFRALTHNGLTAAELERAKSQLKGNLVLGRENTSSRMSRLAKLELYLRRFPTLTETLSQIASVTVEEVHQLASEMLAGEKLLVTRLEPSFRRRQKGP